MLDPLTSIGLATNIVQLVEFGLKVAATGRQIASTGTTEDHSHLKGISQNISLLCDDIQKQIGRLNKGPTKSHLNRGRHQEDTCEHEPARSVNENTVRHLALRTRVVADDLGMMLVGLKIDDSEQETPNNTPLGSETSRKRKRSVANRIVKALWKDSDIQRLRRQLVELQQELTLNLTVMQSQSSSNVLRELGCISQALENQDKRASRLAELEKCRHEVLEKAERIVGSMDQHGAVELLSSSFDKMSSQVRTINSCQRILRTLAFEEMNTRQENIAQAHASTFDWIFRNPKLDFTDWASAKDGLFWITGKAGSGKSTLMKYIVEDPRTQRLLEKWAGDHEVTTAHYFFWNAGTEMQKSQVGLLRTLLFHIVRQCPDKALELIPHRFQDMFALGATPWTLPELCKTLEAFGRQADLGTRICFFIDGLDEYHGDHQDLVEYLGKLIKCPSFKFCVSSRPWNAFRCAYDMRTDGQLAVEALTKRDIQAYVHDKMNGSPLFKSLRASNPEDCIKLIREISDKAQGVFLWVYLVVRSFLRGLNNKDSPEILRKRLHEYPESLNGYFQRMVNRIESFYRRHSARIMLAALMAEGALPYCAPHYLEQEVDDANYSLKLPICDNNKSFTADEMRTSRLYLDARCADLLEIMADGICFLHRTAKDFLEQRVMKQTLADEAGADFDPGLSLARLALAQMKSGSCDGVALGSLVREMLSYEHIIQTSSVASFCSLLDHFDANGDSIFSALSGPVTYFAETKNGVTLIDETNGAYKDSLLAFEIASTLPRLRETRPIWTHEFSFEDNKKNQEADFNTLFGELQEKSFDTDDIAMESWRQSAIF